MLFTSALAVFLISWSCLFLVDYLLRLKNYLPYVQFANNHGLEISPFQLRLYTSRWHDSSGLPGKDKGTAASLRRTLAALWFGFGAIVSLVCLIGISAYLTKLLAADVVQLAAYRPKVTSYRAMHLPTAAPPVAEPPIDNLPPPPAEDYDILDGGQRSNDGLVPIIPGVNLPWNHIPIFMIVLIVAAVIHEMGHSIAATSNDVKVNGFGVFIFALYPGAFTDIEPTSLKRASPFSRLMIFGGGIWHNLVLAGIAYLLFLATPTVLSPLFAEGAGVTVTGVDVRSGLYGSSGLSAGFVVDSIESCPVRRIGDWRECVRRLEHEHNGRCVHSSHVEASKTDMTTVTEDEVQCCAPFLNVTPAHMCFETTVLVVSTQHATKAPSLNKVLRMGGADSNPLDEVVRESRELAHQYSCMSARYVTEQPICNTSGICEQTDKDDPRVCVYPALFNGTQLARISVRDQTKPVLYVGNLDELISFVSIDGMVSRWSWVPHWWADAAQLLPKYLFTLSVALAALNAVPCYALDGQHIVVTLVNWIGVNLPKRRRQQIIALILLFGTFLLGSNIVIGFVKFLL